MTSVLAATRTEKAIVVEKPDKIIVIKQTDPKVIKIVTPGPRGSPGAKGSPGPSGLEAEVSTDFSLIYKLST